jgi:hypothetical protein
MMYNSYIRMGSKPLSIYLAAPIILFAVNIQAAYGQDAIDNWQTYVDPAGRFTIFYPPDLQAQGKENFLSSVDLTLGNPNFAREFKITITYNDDDSSLVDYVNGLQISPENYLLAIENQLRPSYQVYNLLGQPSNSDELYGFPTVSNTVDFTNHLGESGRTMNVLAIINGQGSFMFTYSNTVEAFYEYVPTVNQIMKSIVILK